MRETSPTTRWDAPRAEGDEPPEDARIPNLFLVGAPKSGTSSMYDWLRQHPEVFMAEFKEPRYFAEDLTWTWRYDDWADYLALFRDAADETWVGEASTAYLRSEAAADRIREACGPDVRVIAMLRNPIEMVHAFHSQLVYMGNEPITDFETAYEAQAARRKGERVPERPNPLEGVFYSTFGAYHTQLTRYLDAFGEANVHAVLFDDLVEDDRAVYEGTCRFLGIEPRLPDRMEKKNPNTTVRSHTLRELARDPPAPVKAVTERLPDGVRRRLRNLAEALNTSKQDREPLSAEMHARLAEDYRAEIEQLSELLGRDLSHWLEPEPG